MNFKLYLEGLIVAAIGGAVPAVVSALSNPVHQDWRHLGMLALSGAIISVGAWLRTPPSSGTTGTTPVDKFPETR